MKSAAQDSLMACNEPTEPPSGAGNPEYRRSSAALCMVRGLVRGSRPRRVAIKRLSSPYFRFEGTWSVRRDRPVLTARLELGQPRLDLDLVLVGLERLELRLQR